MPFGIYLKFLGLLHQYSEQKIFFSKFGVKFTRMTLEGRNYGRNWMGRNLLFLFPSIFFCWWAGNCWKSAILCGFLSGLRESYYFIARKKTFEPDLWNLEAIKQIIRPPKALNRAPKCKSLLETNFQQFSRTHLNCIKGGHICPRKSKKYIIPKISHQNLKKCNPNSSHFSCWPSLCFVACARQFLRKKIMSRPAGKKSLIFR